MKRRTFNQAALAALAAGIGMPLPAASASRGTPTLERLRHSAPKEEGGWHPFTLGIGQRGREFAARLHRSLAADRCALIYADAGLPLSSAASAPGCSLPRLLENAYSGLMIVSLDEPETWPSALEWAQRMNDHEVYLKTAIVCAAEPERGLSHPLTRLLYQQIDTLIVHQDSRAESDLSALHPVLQTLRIFHMDHAIPCCDIADIRSALEGRVAMSAASQALTAASDGDLIRAVDDCCSQVHGRPVTGVIARWTAGIDACSIANFDLIHSRLQERLHDDCALVLTATIDDALPRMAPGMLHTVWALSEE